MVLAYPQQRKKGERMSLPSKPQQIAAVAALLDSEATEGLSLEEVAKRVVEGYHKTLLGKLKPAPSPARLGMLFKTPLDGKVRRLVWEGGDRVWIISETDSYGWLGPADRFLDFCEEYRPKRRRDGKMVELSDEEIEEEWSNPDWKVGDVVSQHQRQYSFEIIAVSPASVLLRSSMSGRLTVDSNANLKRYYRREVKGLEGGW